MIEPRLLAGPPPSYGAETFRDHVARLGPMPSGGTHLIRELEASGLRGRGGAAFPVATKWQSVAGRAGGDARVLVNGTEGEPLSAKDRTVMSMRPHLVLDGAEIAAQSVGATGIVLYVGTAHGASWVSLERAITERGRRGRRPSIRMVAAPHAYVAGEESAAVHFVNDGDARPTGVTPRPFVTGVDGRPTLVHNVETLATVGLIARYGSDWFRQPGRGGDRGSSLVTVSDRAGMLVREIEIGTRVGELAGAAGGRADSVGAVLLGGYFGTWSAAEEAWGFPLDPQLLRAAGLSFGAGVVSFLAREQCGIRATADILDFMAGQSAAQCGPCVFGLRAMADVADRLAAMTASASEIERLERWSQQLVGRGACRHPDGAAGLLLSALTAFAADFESHIRFRRCTAATARMAA